jgi:tRNA(Ile)-lysidine synthase
MNKLEENIRPFFRRYSPQKWYIACSGGLDSMVLLHLTLAAGIQPHILHVNYGLRDEESDEDERFLSEFAAKNNLEIMVKKVNLKKQLEQQGGNLQQAAREVRYAFFRSVLSESDKLLIAHHANDQVETFILNLGRGATMRGLAGMAEDLDHFLRPLLPYTKKQLESYAQNQGISWREDSSNATLKYRRNLIRHVIQPTLEKIDPDFNDHTLTLIQAFQHTLRSLEQEAEPIAFKWEKERKLATDVIKELSPEVLGEVLRAMGESPDLTDYLQHLCTLENSKKILSKFHSDRIYIKQNDHISIIDLNSTPRELPLLSFETVSELPQVFSKDVIFIDPKKIKGDLHIRRTETGDRIKPIGLQGSKLISNLLKDAKVLVEERPNVLIVHDDEKIIWCVGYAISREAVASDQSEILKVQFVG